MGPSVQDSHPQGPIRVKRTDHVLIEADRSHANNTMSRGDRHRRQALIKSPGIEVAVTKRDLVGIMALEARLTKVQATRALEAFLRGVRTGLIRGDRVTLSGFGTFGVSHRKARRVRNPRNGDAMEIAARRVPRFAPGVELKSALERVHKA